MATARFEPFGSDAPLAEPSWYQGLATPYYTESHVAWRQHVRSYVDEELEPVVADWDIAAVTGDSEQAEAFFRNALKSSCKRGIVASVCGQWPTKYTDVRPPDGCDAFHELITIDELFRVGCGVGWHTEGAAIGLPPVITFGVPGDLRLQDGCARAVLAGEKIICLAVTEPTGGSDVAAIRTTAQDMGDHFLVNGEKKWITNGIYADYFTVAVRTGGDGSKGISMLLIERTAGVETRKMDCQGVWPSGTTFITFTDVRVPKSNIIGELGHGFKQIMYNFNHERWALTAQVARMARTCVEESIVYARKRKTFGKKLIEHQVIQHKIAEMGRLCEALQAWIEFITFQFKIMNRSEQNQKLGGHIALMKVNATKVCAFCASEATQVFGGAAYTRTGQGEKVERVYRELRNISIGGGSEEIMLNLAAGQFRFVGRPTLDVRDKRIAELEDEVRRLRTLGSRSKL